MFISSQPGKGHQPNPLRLKCDMLSDMKLKLSVVLIVTNTWSSAFTTKLASFVLNNLYGAPECAENPCDWI